MYKLTITQKRMLMDYVMEESVCFYYPTLGSVVDIVSELGNHTIGGYIKFEIEQVNLDITAKAADDKEEE